MPWDSKYGEITVERTPGAPFGDDEPVILFRARDATTPALLTAYLTLCLGRKCSAGHIEAIQTALRRFRKWQGDNRDAIKTPD